MQNCISILRKETLSLEINVNKFETKEVYTIKKLIIDSIKAKHISISGKLQPPNNIVYTPSKILMQIKIKNHEHILTRKTETLTPSLHREL